MLPRNTPTVDTSLPFDLEKLPIEIQFEVLSTPRRMKSHHLHAPTGILQNL